MEIQVFEQNFCKSLRLYVDYKIKHEGKGSVTRLAKTIGVAQSHLSNVIAGRKFGTESWRRSVAKKLGLVYEEMIGLNNTTPSNKSKQQIIIQSDNDIETKQLEKVLLKYKSIPLYEQGRLFAGNNGITFDPYEEPASFVIIYKPELRNCFDHRLLALRVGGDSMEPIIPHNSIVVVDIDDKELIDGEIYCINVADSGGVAIAGIKRIRKWVKGNGFVLISDNYRYPPDISILDWSELCAGRVIWMWRSISGY